MDAICDYGMSSVIPACRPCANVGGGAQDIDEFSFAYSDDRQHGFDKEAHVQIGPSEVECFCTMFNLPSSPNWLPKTTVAIA